MLFAGQSRGMWDGWQVCLSLPYYRINAHMTLNYVYYTGLYSLGTNHNNSGITYWNRGYDVETVV